LAGKGLSAPNPTLQPKKSKGAGFFVWAPFLLFSDKHFFKPNYTRIGKNNQGGTGGFMLQARAGPNIPTFAAIYSTARRGGGATRQKFFIRFGKRKKDCIYFWRGFFPGGMFIRRGGNTFTFWPKYSKTAKVLNSHGQSICGKNHQEGHFRLADQAKSTKGFWIWPKVLLSCGPGPLFPSPATSSSY